MNLLEHEAKHLLRDASIPVPAGVLVKKGEPAPRVTLPAVLKSQVPTGGRGKAGGIKVVESEEELKGATQQLFAHPIKDLLPNSLLAEEKLAIERELYLSLRVDRDQSAIILMAHSTGGIEVEDNHDFKEWVVKDYSADVLGQALADYYELPEQTFALQDVVENLKTCLVKNDALLIEINPLILTSDNRLVAGDAKMTLDDAAAFRHDWQFEEAGSEANFVTINEQGNTATIANGAGLAMATVDAAVDAGLHPANFLDIGGGASTETLLAAFHRLMDYPQLRVIIINIFAGITRADEVARAIVAARQHISDLPPLFIRIAGTNFEEAAEILAAASIPLLPTLDECLAAAKKELYE